MKNEKAGDKIFEIKHKKDKFIEKCYKKSMKELSQFYELNWIRNTPVLVLLNNRREIDEFTGRKTEDWVVGWNNGSKIFLLNPNQYEKESSHKYSEEEFLALIKHELSHSFLFAKTQKAKYIPKWFNEGMAIFSSGQNNFKKNPKKFEKILSYYDEGGDGIYKESGFFIEVLVNKFGKNKLMKLIEGLNTINNKKDFNGLFKKIYGFSLTYKNINQLKK